MRLKLKKGNRLSPQIEKCCLLLVGNESFVNAERDLEILTGVKVAHSTQHRLVNRYQLPEPQITKRAKSLSIGSGSVESWIKQIGSRLKIIGAQWNSQNVSQILKLRCAYLNSDTTLSIFA